MRNRLQVIAPRAVRGPCPRGFSLVELIVVIVVTGIMASTVGLFIAGPIQAFFDQARRGELVDAAQLAQLRMGRDLRGALPNSVRVQPNAIEMLYTLDGDRYRTEPATGATAADRLEFTIADGSFNTLARLDASQTANASALRLAVYPLGQSGADPYLNTVLTAAGNTVNLASTATVGGVTEYRVSLNTVHLFPFDSPTKRVFLVEGPVSYVCAVDPLETVLTRLTLFRYAGYAVNATQPVPPTGVTPVAIVRNVQACAFTYAAGTAQRNAVVSLSLTLASQGEQIRLLRQVQVDNSP